MKILNSAKEKFFKILEVNNLLNEYIKISMKPLSPEEVIGHPVRDDYPLLSGKEVMIEADFKGGKGQVFTDEPSNFEGTIIDILNIDLNSNRKRAIFIAALNAVLKYLGIIEKTIHCKNSELEICAKKVADYLFKKFGKATITLIGLQPGFATELIKVFGYKNIAILDLNYKNIGKSFNGVEIKDSREFSKYYLKKNFITLATGSTIVNNTIDDIVDNANNVIFFGVTIAGVSKLLHLDRICFEAH